jgi:hypothetical protein
MFGQRDIELAQDSPTTSTEGEVANPMVGGRMSPKSTAKGKVMMMSTTDRESISNRGSSSRSLIQHKKPTWDKTCKTFGSLCMAVFLFAGGIVSFTLPSNSRF